LNESNEVLPIFYSTIYILLVLIGINIKFTNSELFFWFGNIFFPILLYLIISGSNKKKSKEIIFENINVITKLEIEDELISIYYFNTQSDNEAQISIPKNEFVIYLEKIHLDYKLVINEIDIYFAFSEFVSDYSFKKCFNFQVPILQKQGPKLSLIDKFSNKYLAKIIKI
jgi:hypothetical protein